MPSNDVLEGVEKATGKDQTTDVGIAVVPIMPSIVQAVPPKALEIPKLFSMLVKRESLRSNPKTSGGGSSAGALKAVTEPPKPHREDCNNNDCE